MGYEDLTRAESQTNQETGLTRDVLNVLVPLSFVESATFSDDLSSVSPLPHYEEKYPPEIFPMLYTEDTASKIEQFDRDIDAINILIRKAKQHEQVGSPEDLKIFDAAYNDMLVVVRGSNSKKSDFKHLSEVNKDEFMSA
ncbi:MAG: hypothetical protein JWP09_105 [Candidatus Taylorbacteria bacterium]|nr:hypothetical protein [Candidatus Taylorbacteria bacterium]